MDMNMKAWQNPYSFAHEYSGWVDELSELQGNFRMWM